MSKFLWWHRKPRHVDLDWGMFTPEQRVLVETKLAIVDNDLDEMTQKAAARQQEVDDLKKVIALYANPNHWVDSAEGKARVWGWDEPGYRLARDWVAARRRQQ